MSFVSHFDESGYGTPGVGLGMINGDRYELFLNNDKKGTGAIDWVIRKAIENGAELSDREVMTVREAIISFANVPEPCNHLCLWEDQSSSRTHRHVGPQELPV
jgi:hypothetical protein